MVSDLKTEALHLRREKRLSYSEIQDHIGVPKGTLSGWLKDYPLTEEESRRKMAVNSYTIPKKERGSESLLHQMVADRTITPSTKAKVAEAAALLRIVLHGLPVFGSPFDGDKADWVVEAPSGRLLKIQVKSSLKTRKHGLPVVSLRCTEGHGRPRRYEKGEFDVIIGYDLYTDTCYVWAFEELDHLKSGITVHPDAAERWDKILGL